MGLVNVQDKSGGRTAVQSNKSDMNLEQLGGEGGGKTGDVLGKNSDIAFHPHRDVDTKYTGKGRNLSVEDF